MEFTNVREFVDWSISLFLANHTETPPVSPEILTECDQHSHYKTVTSYFTASTIHVEITLEIKVSLLLHTNYDVLV